MFMFSHVRCGINTLAIGDPKEHVLVDALLDIGLMDGRGIMPSALDGIMVACRGGMTWCLDPFYEKKIRCDYLGLILDGLLNDEVSGLLKERGEDEQRV